MIANLTPTGTPDEFTVTLPAPGERTSYQYFFTLQNSRQQPITTPTAAPTDNVFFEFFYDADEILPEIVHEPVTNLDDRSTQLLIEASITDEFTGVDSAFIEYSINDVPQANVLMERNFSDGFRPDLYVGVLTFPVGLNEGDRITYRIIANDKSATSNLISSPEENGTYEIIITKTLDAINFYVNDFEVDDNDFNGNGFSITQPNNFGEQAIHSIHPYTLSLIHI